MKCPKCDCSDTQVKDSRNQIGMRRRRRHCKECGHKFTTTEIVGIYKGKGGKYPLFRPDVVKRDGKAESFEQERYRASVVRACARLEVSPKDVDEVVEVILDRVDGSDEQFVRSSELVDWTVRALVDIDRMAAMRYAIQYMEFKNPEQFQKFSLKFTK